MDIELLSKMIGELVLDNDQVGLPGLGTFIAELVPASFSDRGYTINPPYRRLYFIPGEQENRLLVDFYAAQNGIEARQSRIILQDFLSGVRTSLETRKVVVFPGLGRLRATRSNQFFFVANEDLDIYPAGFGLRPISLKTHEESYGEVVAAVGAFADMVNGAALGASMPESEAAIEPESAPDTATPEDPAASADISAAGPEPAPVSVTAPVTAAPSVPDTPAAPAHPKRKYRPLLWVMLAVVLLAVLVIGGFLILVQVAPGFVDLMLYSPEELRIINS